MPASIFGVALLLRILNLQQIRANDPFFDLPSPDPLFYHRWAMEIASGNLLGEGVFLQGPLYPYLLGVVYWIFGPGFLVPRLLQCVLGALTCLLTWRVGCALFDRRVGAVAGLAAAVYSMSIFYEGSLLIANILLPLNLVLLWNVLRAGERPSFGRWVGVGVLLGLTCLARPNMLLYFPFLVLWLPWNLAGQQRLRQSGALLGALALGLALCLGPSLLRNVLVSGDWVLVSASAGMNFYNGNNSDANGSHDVPGLFSRTLADDPLEQNRIYKAHAEGAVGRALLASEVSDYWRGRGLEWVAENPGDWLALVGRKLLLFVNAHELWNNRSFTLSQQFSWVLRLPLLTFGVVAPFALLGIALSVPRWRDLLPVHALLGVYVATCVIFFVLSRYRMPVLPVLLIFAASAVVWLYDEIRGGRTKPVGLALVGLLIAFALVRIDLVDDDLSVAYYNLGNKYLTLEKYELAVEQYVHSIQIDESYISAYNNLGLALERSGKLVEATAAWRQVLRMAEQRRMPKYVERARGNLARLEAELEAEASGSSK